MEIERHWSFEEMASEMGATKADMPGLWNVPGHPELTEGQLLSIWLARKT